MMFDFLVIGILAVIVAAACSYIYRAKKSGKKCIGCPDGCSCGGEKDGSSCGGCCSHH